MTLMYKPLERSMRKIPTEFKICPKWNLKNKMLLFDTML